jgi:deazaflavin-dependent oxidoreductase (nitroreductase family)
MGYRELVNKFSTTSFGRFIGKTLAARIDPALYKLSGGRVTSVGPQVIPQLVLTTTGRKSGKERSVQLGFTADRDDYIVVASNWGGEKHPAWSYNLDAHPKAQVQVGKDTKRVLARRLSSDEKKAIWPKLVANVPQYATYVSRTDRDIKVYRLSPQ